MTAAELIAALSTVPGDRMIVMSKDGEGNSYSPLAEIDGDSRYVADSTWSGEVIHPDDWAEYEDDDALVLTPVVCLWPVN